jgi:hypothetical protein
VNTNSNLVAVFLGLLQVLLVARASGAELPEKPKELLELLKARDAQFDNVHVSYIRRGVDTPPTNPYWMFPGEKPKAQPTKPTAFRFKEQMMLRGAETTVVRDLYTMSPAPSDSGTMYIPHHKWSDTDGLVRHFHEDKRYDDRSMEIRRGESTPVGIVSAKRREVEFSLGFGFGRRIKTISSVTRKDRRLVLEGSIQIWQEDVSTFRLSIDEDLVVRDAVIKVEAEGNQTRYDVSTEGSVKDDGFVFARTGHYARTALGLKSPPVELEVPFEPHITDEFDIDFKAAKFHLSDDEYKTFTKMEIPPGTHVTDHVTNKRYTVDRNNQISKKGPLVPGGR